MLKRLAGFFVIRCDVCVFRRCNFQTYFPLGFLGRLEVMILRTLAEGRRLLDDGLLFGHLRLQVKFCGLIAIVVIGGGVVVPQKPVARFKLRLGGSRKLARLNDRGLQVNLFELHCVELLRLRSSSSRRGQDTAHRRGRF